MCEKNIFTEFRPLIWLLFIYFCIVPFENIAQAEHGTFLRFIAFGIVCVEYLGHINREQVRDVLSKSEVGISTLLKVGQYADESNLPTKAHEYMTMGLPVILTDIPYNVAFVEKYKCGVCVDPMDTKAYAEAIEYLFAHPDEAKQMGLNGRKAVEQEFNWDTQAAKLLELYRELGAR